jgi:diaminohydroxyphosphoribosylaminopyrimidine deaminase/5-amino-6-(5-phosphoribosylamino)uracil reductase
MPSSAASDEQFLRRALDLARQGVGLASPNPCVGAIIVDLHANIVGSGVYLYENVKHAEVLALEQAGERARGGTLYINLEPHSHQGRTPPCTDALIAGGIRRVVASMADPNPKVSGRGFEKLRAAGIQVDAGQLEPEARRLNEAFARYTLHRVPLVTLKSAMSLDGKIARPRASDAPRANGISGGEWITGVEARAHVHGQRHQSDAIMAGVGTILADDPLLTDRSGKPRRRPLLRVILDSKLRVPLESRLVKSVVRDGEGKSDVLVFCSNADENRMNELEARGICVEPVPHDPEGHPDICEVIRRLGLREITSAIIEGGSTINRAALARGVADKVFLYYAPTIIAESGAVPFAANSAADYGITQVRQTRLHRFGEDIAIEGYLRDPYAG